MKLALLVYIINRLNLKKKKSVTESLSLEVIISIIIFLNEVDPYKNYLGSNSE